MNTTSQLQQISPLHMQLFFIGLGLLCIFGMLPLAMNLIKPNPFAGVRVRATLSNERVWYLANSYFAKRLILTGFITIVLAVALRLTAISLATYGLICTISLLGGLFLVTAMTFIYIKRIS